MVEKVQGGSRIIGGDSEYELQLKQIVYISRCSGTTIFVNDKVCLRKMRVWL